MYCPTGSLTIATVEALIASSEALIASSEAEGRPVCFVVDGDYKTITVEEDQE